MRRSEQEELIGKVTAIIFGGMELMQPDLYRTPPKEPADLAWVIDRCAFLINMTSGNKSFHSKRAHNHKQLNTWLRRWSRGEVLRGNALRGPVSFAYDDVDYIIGISVVGGEAAANSFDLEELETARVKVTGDPRKIVFFVTISEDIISALAENRLLARDFVAIIKILMAANGVVSDQDLLNHIDDYTKNSRMLVTSNFGLISVDPVPLNSSLDYISSFFHEIKNKSYFKEVSPYFCDLKFVDLLWIAVARRVLASRVGIINGVLITHVNARWHVGNFYIACHVFLRSGHALDYIKKVGYNSNDIEYYQYLDFGKHSPMGLWALPPRLERSMLYKEVADASCIHSWATKPS